MSDENVIFEPHRYETLGFKFSFGERVLAARKPAIVVGVRIEAVGPACEEKRFYQVTYVDAVVEPGSYVIDAALVERMP